MPKVPLVLAGMIASARALTFALRFTEATGRVRTQMIVATVLATAAFVAWVLLLYGR